PFVRDTPMELLVAHVHEKPTPLGEVRPEVPEDLQAVVMKCLEKEPAQRYQTAEELEQALAQCACADLWTRQAAAPCWRESDTAPSSAVTALAGEALSSRRRLLLSKLIKHFTYYAIGTSFSIS